MAPPNSNRPILRLERDQHHVSPGEIFPLIHPWRELYRQHHQQLAIYHADQYYCEGRLLSYATFPSLYQVADFAFLWAADHPEPQQIRNHYHDLYQATHDLTRTPFAPLVLERLPASRPTPPKATKTIPFSNH